MEEDSSLDDFFAKKDKSKKKNKAKMTTTASELMSHKEKHAKKQRQKHEKETKNQPGLTDRASNDVIVNKQKETEDWQDFEEEQEKDYSGLRIQSLQLSKDPNAEEQNEEEQEETQEDDTESTKTTRDLSQGPWKQSATPVSTPVVRAAAPEPVKSKEETPKTGGKYIPPSMRGLSSSTSSSSNRTRPGYNKRSAPNITSEMDFPSLGGNKTPVVQDLSECIENPNQRGKLNLTLGNKFSALQN